MEKLPYTFRHIEFGRASAEVESVDVPQLLTDGYLDLAGITEEAITGSKFLFLGYKGSGKTALAERLKIVSSTKEDLSVNHIFLSDFPYDLFKKVASGSHDDTARLPASWSWLLVLLILDSVSKDRAASSTSGKALSETLIALRKVGLLPAKNINDIIRSTDKRIFKVKFPFDFGFEVDFSSERVEEYIFPRLVDCLKDLLTTISTKTRHLLVLDGLDEIMSGTELQYQSLSALVTEATHLNLFFKKLRSPFKIIVLCRTDLFERLPASNKNKLRQDFASEFDWYHDPRSPESCQLVILGNLRAALTYKGIPDLRKTFFPSHISYGFLLGHTRHTPRDYLQLLKHLQPYSKNNAVLSDYQITSGLRDYSVKYFLPEIRDEMVGYVDSESFDEVLNRISKVNSREFHLDDIVSQISTHRNSTKEELCHIFEQLYNCSGIGQIEKPNRETTFFYFKYRNRHSAFNPDRRIILHRGLWKSMNTPNKAL